MKKKQRIAVIGPNPIQSMDGSNPCPTLMQATITSIHKHLNIFRGTFFPTTHQVVENEFVSVTTFMPRVLNSFVSKLLIIA